MAIREKKLTHSVEIAVPRVSHTFSKLFPLVSVLICVYNGEKTLAMCLDSVFKQTYPQYEVIIVDNHSTDQTRMIIFRYQRLYPHIRYVFEPRVSLGAARAAGLAAIRGDIVAVTDADCIVPSEWLENLTLRIRRGEESAVMGPAYDLSGTYWSRQIQKAETAFIQRQLVGGYLQTLDIKNFAIISTILKDVGFDPDAGFFEDIILYIRLRPRVKIRFVPDVPVGHFHRRSLAGVLRMNFIRAYWTYRAYRRLRSEVSRMDTVLWESISLTNLALFPFWVVLNFLTKPWSYAFYLLVADTAWRCGLAWGIGSNTLTFFSKK